MFSHFPALALAMLVSQQLTFVAASPAYCSTGIYSDISQFSNNRLAQAFCSLDFPVAPTTYTSTVTLTQTAATSTSTATTATVTAPVMTITAPASTTTTTMTITTMTSTVEIDTMTDTAAETVTVTVAGTTMNGQKIKRAASTSITTAKSISSTSTKTTKDVYASLLSLGASACACVTTPLSTTVTSTSITTITPVVTVSPSVTVIPSTTITPIVTATMTTTVTNTNTITSIVSITTTTTVTATSTSYAPVKTPVPCDSAQANSAQNGLGGCSYYCHCETDAQGGAQCSNHGGSYASCKQDSDCALVDEFCDTVNGPDKGVCESHNGCGTSYTSSKRSLFGSYNGPTVGRMSRRVV